MSHHRVVWLFVLASAEAFAFEEAPAVQGQLLVRFKEGVSKSAIDDAFQLMGGSEAKQVTPVDSQLYLVDLPAGMDNATGLSLYNGFAAVALAEPNFIYSAVAEPDDPMYFRLWGLPQISAPAAWDITTGSQANVVAVVDTGLDYTHPDLVDNVWSAPEDFTVHIGDVDITCPAGSHGFNAITNACDPLDDNGHGTHCSGVIGAVGNNGIGVSGINWTASIMGAKFLGASGTGSTSDAVKAIQFTIQAKQIFANTGGANVRVLSNSWGGGPSQTLADAIALAQDNDILFVVAAGNGHRDIDVSPLYPASYGIPNEIVVAGTDNQDGRYVNTNYGINSVHLGAPAVRVDSTYRGGYAYLTGTSMATPQVSGAAILILSACDLDTPTLKQVILDNVDPIDSMSGITATGGRLNVYSALSACTSAAQ